MTHIHIIGAGLAGLSAAVELVAAGHRVTLYDAARRAGGRCRSYYDAQLGQVIDNGNHLVLSGNTSTARYTKLIGADGFHVPSSARFPFMDIRDQARWAIDVNEGRVPVWMFQRSKRAAHTSWKDYLPALKILLANQEALLSTLLDTASPAFERFWEPLMLAVLNTPLNKAAACLLRPVFTETILKGGAHCRPMIARTSLADALIDPALTKLETSGAEIRFGARFMGLEERDDCAQHLRLGGEAVEVGRADAVVIALPSWQAADTLPWLDAPGAGEGILNIHYAVQTGVFAPEFLGLIGSLAQWVFVRADAASVTVSAAGKALEERPDDLARRCWAEIAQCYGWDQTAVPPFRVIKEKRATFDQSPAGLKKRRPVTTRLRNVFLAGDWTQTGLPATIEGAIRSGQTAAAAIFKGAALSPPKSPFTPASN
ncbi:MAG: hydroxysqualene dehydroxylase HpnE [Pseudomonadota bacterium]